MADKKIKSIPKNLKISTRIFITSVLAIIIPTIIIVILAISLIFFASERFNYSNESSGTYSIISQLQWSQIASELTDELISFESDEQKLEMIKDKIASLEEMNTLVYISKNNENFYKTDTDIDIVQKAEEISDDESDKNLYYLGENGLVLISTTVYDNDEYRLIFVNENYIVSDNAPGKNSESFIGMLINRASIVMAVVLITFITAIIIISFITTKTIVGPIEELTIGANEFSKGNFDYEIKYKSRNEIGQLADSFNEMRLRLRESIEERNRADQKQKEMIAGIAHDLRTPLTSVKGYLEGLRDGIADTPEKRDRYMEIIYNSTIDTEKMLDDLLAISKFDIGAVSLNCEKVNIPDFIEFAGELGEMLEKNDFDFEIIDKTRTSPNLYVDTDNFIRVINNIISNSIKYRRPDVKGKIVLTISEYKHTVIFEMKDNGMGVDKESLPRIFDTLYRADKARTNVRNGTGLGLAVCKQIVEMHGGLIWAQSEFGNGLSIFISLPIYKEE